MSAVIQTWGLHKRYGQHPALESLDLKVEEGSVFGLIGPNGAGKTTTLRILLDIIRPTAGKVSVLGADPRVGGARLRQQIGYVPGDLRLQGRLRGRDLLERLAQISGPVPPGAIEQLAERLGADLSRPVRTLSKGNKQKLGLIQAFMHQPKLLVLDEPTSGLDPLVQREFLGLVREARSAGQTVLLSSHVLSEIQQAADQVAVLSEGKIVAEGPVASLRLASIRRVRATVSGWNEADMREALGSLSEVTELSLVPDAEHVRVSLTWRGEIDPLIRALTAGTVRDLTVEEPDLEESVLSLYQPEGEGL